MSSKKFSIKLEIENPNPGQFHYTCKFAAMGNKRIAMNNGTSGGMIKGTVDSAGQALFEATQKVTALFENVK